MICFLDFYSGTPFSINQRKTAGILDHANVEIVLCSVPKAVCFGKCDCSIFDVVFKVRFL